MEGSDDPKEFPDVSQKLAAPKKLSQFEKDRQAAQIKQQRAEAENAAALRAFQSAFAADDDEDDGLTSGFGGDRGPPSGPPSGPRGSGLGFGAKRGYGGPPRSGPGSLGNMPGPPPPSLKRKRALDEMREAQEARREQEDLLSYDAPQSTFRSSPKRDMREEEREIDTPRPTIHLASLPPDIAQDDVKTLLKDYFTVHSVRFIPPDSRSATKRSQSAIVTLFSEVSSSQIDAAISALKGKYVGRGFYLSASRHLSSAAYVPHVTANLTGAPTQPFGAEKPRDPRERFNMRNAPPPMDQRGFAPPDSYETPSRMGFGGPNGNNNAIVSVRPPADIEAVKAIHTVVDRLLLEPDPARALQIEATLMSLPEVQRDERFSFLFESQSPAGVYYRFLLWAPDDANDTTRDNKRRDLTIETIHSDIPIEWHPPYSQVPFPELKSLEQVVTDIDYISSDESDDEGGDRNPNSNRDGDPLSNANETNHLTPLQRARFVFLLSRLPTTNTKLRKGDVARVTNFAINHAGTGAEEIVDLLLLNVMKPFSFSLASKYEEAESQDEEDMYEPDDDLSALDSPAPQATASKDSKRDEDPSNAKLVALYVISDILSASSTAGARNAWKYRQLFESGFKAQKTFEHLGKLEKEFSWGRLKAEQWKRKIGVVFGIWEGWSVLSGDVQEKLRKGFFEPPLSEEEKAMVAAEGVKEEEKKNVEEGWKAKFKRVEGAASPATVASPVVQPVVAVAEEAMGGVDGAPLDGELDGAPMADDVDGTPLSDDVDGKPMAEDVDGKPMDTKTEKSQPDVPASISMNSRASGPKKRMTAADMFGDSSDEG